MANIRHIMDAATSHEFSTIPGHRFWLGHTQASDRATANPPVPTVGERYAIRTGTLKNAPKYSARPHLRLHTRQVGGVGKGQYMTQWCVEYGGRRTQWQFRIWDAYADARAARFQFVMHPRTI